MAAMKMKWRAALALALVALVVLAGAAAAMSSPGFRLDWFVNISGGSAGGLASSTSYAANVTLGQTAAGKSASTNYGATLGYWAAFPFETTVYLPLVLRGP